MSAGNSVDAVLLADLIQLSTRAAIGIGDKNVVVFRFVLFNGGFDGAWNFLRIIMQISRQTLNFYVIPLIASLLFDQFPGECAAGNEQGVRRHRTAL